MRWIEIARATYFFHKFEMEFFGNSFVKLQYREYMSRLNQLHVKQFDAKWNIKNKRKRETSTDGVIEYTFNHRISYFYVKTVKLLKRSRF